MARQRQQYPFWVNNGRSNNVWQTLYSNLRQEFVMERFPLPFLQINPADAQKLGVKSSDLVELYNDYGNVTAMAYVSDAVVPRLACATSQPELLSRDPREEPSGCLGGDEPFHALADLGDVPVLLRSLQPSEGAVPRASVLSRDHGLRGRAPRRPFIEDDRGQPVSLTTSART